MSYFEALILGIIQGLTEFLPVSSSGHLELGSVILGTSNEENLLFAVILHLATALSTVIVFREYIWQVIGGIFDFKWNESWKFVMLLIISMVPVGIVGVFFQDYIESLFSGNILLVGSMLLITGALLMFTHFKNDGQKEISPLAAFIIGLAQAFAVLPGISRSGSTIATALLLGIEKSKATQFSFLMVLVPIFGASFLKFKDYLEAPQVSNSISLTALIIGFVAAFVSGYLACSWMIKIVRKGKLTYFSAYCFLVGIIAIVFHYAA